MKQRGSEKRIEKEECKTISKEASSKKKKI
jgi:hypothetical protein